MDLKADEQWKIIPGFKNYLISNGGKIKSITRKVWHKESKTEMTLKGKMMRQRWNKTCRCYFLDLLSDESKRRTIYPHKEVAKLFVPCKIVLPDGMKNQKMMIIHRDNNPRNNSASNLQWMTASDHMKWQFEVGNKNNFKVWKVRKKLYKNGFKEETVLPGRPRKIASVS
ncbi:MAG: HNH endonuclease [Flammeovirgaceae bacterium]|nr:HNH endonuclease [Flammeovirgaceae bacterium]